MKSLFRLTLLCVILAVSQFFVSCSQSTPDPNVINQIVSDRIAAIPSSTKYPTYTLQPTYTPFPTYTEMPTQTPWIKLVTPTSTSTPLFTATNTSTPTITYTPTRTPTSTPTPNATKTVQAIANATKGAYATATKRAQSARATEVAQYKEVSTKDLVTYPDKYKGQKINKEGEFSILTATRNFKCGLVGLLTQFISLCSDLLMISMRIIGLLFMERLKVKIVVQTHMAVRFVNHSLPVISMRKNNHNRIDQSRPVN